MVSPFDETSKVYKCKNGKYKCKNTGKYFTYRTGTFFANSKLGMRDWLYAIIMIANRKNAISSYQLADDLDIPQNKQYFLEKQALLEFEQGKVTREEFVKMEKEADVEDAEYEEIKD